MSDNNESKYGSDVIELSLNGKEYFLIGTAHISRESAELVRKVIEEEKLRQQKIATNKARKQAARELDEKLKNTKFNNIEEAKEELEKIKQANPKVYKKMEFNIEALEKQQKER